MYERMLNKQIKPTIEEMTEYCGENAALFSSLNTWMSDTYQTEQKVVFPYGNKYGWGIAHSKKNKFICNVFAEKNALTVMMRLSNKQCESVYEQLQEYAKAYVDNKYPCNDGGWIHYRLTCKDHYTDIQKLLSVKCS